MSAVVLGREHWFAAIARRWNRAWGDPDDAVPVIYVRQCSGPGWWVVVEPDCDIASECFVTLGDAKRHASALHRLQGWEVVTVTEARA